MRKKAQGGHRMVVVEAVLDLDRDIVLPAITKQGSKEGGGKWCLTSQRALRSWLLLSITKQCADWRDEVK